ncbi:hypothetical protein V8D89_009875 [Ganoderma adspersum]
MTTNPSQHFFISHIDMRSSTATSRLRRPLSASGSAVGFEIVIQGDADGSLKDLAKGAGGDFRYVLAIKDVTKEGKVTQVVLLRLEGALRGRPLGWVGNTIDINKNRGKTFLYLLWKLTA